MKADPPRVVFDCNIYFQAMVSAHGPAGSCLQKVREGELRLYVSDYILAEIRDLPNDAELVTKFGLDHGKVERFIGSFFGFAQYCKIVPEIYRHPLDPDDSHYISLAVGNDAHLVVSRDRHLLNLMDLSRTEAQDFHQRFPQLRVLDPVALLRELPALN